MSKQKKGDDYEKFVGTVYEAILVAEQRTTGMKPILLKKKHKITSRDTTSAEIDIYWEYTMAGITHKVAIECKNHSKRIDLPKIRDFASKIEGLSGIKGVMVTPVGFTPQLITKANSHHIDLIVIREPKPTDWDEDAITKIEIIGNFIQPLKVLNIEVAINAEWALSQGYTDNVALSGFTNEVIIEDKDSNFKYSIYELLSNRFYEKDKEPGVYTWSKSFKNGWLHTPEKSDRLDSLSIKYEQLPTITTTQEINLEKYILAIMEYIAKDGRNNIDEKYKITELGEKLSQKKD
jgi:hypothetical protein